MVGNYRRLVYQDPIADHPALEIPTLDCSSFNETGSSGLIHALQANSSAFFQIP